MLERLRASFIAQMLISVALLLTIAAIRLGSAELASRIDIRDDAALDQIAQLREDVYRLSWKLKSGASAAEVRELQGGLRAGVRDPALGAILAWHESSDLDISYRQLRERWDRMMEPALLSGDSERFLAEVDPFVLASDRLSLQLSAEHLQVHRRHLLIQWGTLGLIAVVLGACLLKVHRRIVTPLRELVAVTDQFRAGSLDLRMTHDSGDEIGRLVTSFNAMADALAASHATLETRVAEKVAYLDHANAALALLFSASRRLASIDSSAESLEDLIHGFQAYLPGLTLTLCLSDDRATPPERLIALHGTDRRDYCSHLDCAGCGLRLAQQACFDVRSQGHLFGQLRARFDDRRSLAPWEADLIRALSDLIATALMLGRQREQEHHMLLLDERNTIARELHDSLAQSLSHLRLEISCTQQLFDRAAPAAEVQYSLGIVRNGLTEAYRQLRELLTTFRLRVKEGEIVKALEEAVAEFARHDGLEIAFEAQKLAVPLTANEQIHLLQIMREALGNCVRHASASVATVRLRQDGEVIELLVEDNGVGMPSVYEASRHHGITIMQERAARINGTLVTMRKLPRGTRVTLRFHPEFLSSTGEQASA